jgi:hypothetical protein
MNPRKYVHAYIKISIYVCVCVYVRVCMCVCMYVCMYVCVYLCMLARNLRETSTVVSSLDAIALSQKWATLCLLFTAYMKNV